jgi:hypothetical protein
MQSFNRCNNYKARVGEEGQKDRNKKAEKPDKEEDPSFRVDTR